MSIFKKNTLIISLMISSISLLILLQCFWIMREYKSAFQTFRNETNLVFRNTIYELLDSRFQTKIIVDSLGQVSYENVAGFVRKDPDIHYNEISSGLLKDEDFKNKLIVLQDIKLKAQHDDFKTDLCKLDSVTDILQPDLARSGYKEMKRFIIRFDSDSLNIDSLRYKFNSQLKDINRELNFQVIIKTPEDTGNYKANGFVTEFVKVSPQYHYAASFVGIPTLLLKDIMPQITFAVFLTLLTGCAFLIMYNNLIAQQTLVKHKNDFISNISHELKTPLATVSVALEALKSFKALDNPKRTEEYLNMAQSELNKLSEMTDKILDMIIYDNKELRFQNERVDLRQVIIQVVESMKLACEKNQVKISTEYFGDVLLVSGSRHHLTQVIINLMDNAVKYSQAPAHIHMILKEEGQHLVLIFKDNGIGISPKFHKRIFEKFYRVPQDDVYNVKGHGLGLSYVAQVIEGHMGSIEVESQLGTGSSFFIKLPRYGSN